MDQMKLIESFKTDLKTRGKSADTVKQYPRYVKKLLEFSGDLLAVDQDVLAEYLEHLLSKKIDITSIIRYFAALSTFYNFLVFKKYILVNPITPVFRQHYFQRYKKKAARSRQIITIEQARLLAMSILDPRDRAMVVLLLKTGIRRKELSELDVTGLDLKNLTLHVNPTGKRTNTVVYFDEETARTLLKWLVRREKMNTKGSPALFLNRYGNRLGPAAIDRLFSKYAEAVGLHDPQSPRLEDRLGPHCCRHWFTTHLRRAGMSREFIQKLRGDVSRESIDIYDHIDPKELRESYLAHIPQLGL
jgi:integrase/recombinase XerD